MMPNGPRRTAEPHRVSTNKRLRLLYAAFIVIIGVIVLRLFYLQIIRHDHYRQAALNDQLKQYTIAADRGIIYAHQGDNVVPLVLNQKLYTLYADPTLVNDPSGSAAKLTAITHGNEGQYVELMKDRPYRYEVLAKRLSAGQQKKILALDLPGIGLQAQDYRVYPQGDLAANLLGFVDANGQGQYGIEQEFNSQLAGQPGQLKAITDVNGVPLAANRGNIQKNPVAGDNVTLTIDTAMQQQVESILKQGLEHANSQSGTVVVMDPNTGAIKAMASYPSFNPAAYYEAGSTAVFNNLAVSEPLEVGSIMKTLSISTGLNQGVINPNTTYYDPGYVKIDGATIKNVEAIPETPTSIKDVLKYSLNTGAVHTFKMLGGGQFDQRGRDILFDYYTNHFQLGKQTGIQLPNESSGYVQGPDAGGAPNLRYADMSFGQGITATMLQMDSAFSSIINGGTYYKPYIVGSVTKPDGKTGNTNIKIVKHGTVTAQTSSEMRGLLQYVYTQNYNVYESDLHPGYNVGGKTGTAQISNPAGGYYSDKFNGTFLGYVGGNAPQYAVAVLVNQPNLPSYETGGAQAAAPIFGKVADMLINDFNVLPASH